MQFIYWNKTNKIFYINNDMTIFYTDASNNNIYEIFAAKIDGCDGENRIYRIYPTNIKLFMYSYLNDHNDYYQSTGCL
jgi:hypothetical protein